MQMTIYYTEEDQYLIDKVDELAHRERKSRSAVILSILEWYFEGDKRLGEILVDMGKLQPEQIEEILQSQQDETQRKLIGELLVQAGLVSRKDVLRALAIQGSKAPSSASSASTTTTP